MKTKYKKYPKTVIANDLHIPYEDKKAVELWFQFIQWFKPELIVLNGDVADFFMVSKFSRSPLEGKRLKEEIDLVKKFLERIRKVCPHARVIYILGNHEIRLEKYMMRNAGEIFELVKIEDLLHIDGVELVNESTTENFVQVVDLFIGHYNRVSKHAGYTVKNIMDDRGVNIVQAHTHRMGFYTKRLLNGKTLYGWENGCLCNLNPPYVVVPNWQLGFSVIDPYFNGEKYTYFLIKINNGGNGYHFKFNGKVFHVK